jgi:hypothetical protein
VGDLLEHRGDVRVLASHLLGEGLRLLEVDLLRRKPNGRWPLQKRIPGTLLVEMEKPGGESRWNTLRALRIMRSRANAPS